MSLIKQIEEKDALIKQYHKQLEKIQEWLNITMLTLEQRMELEAEVNVIKDELNKLDESLNYTAVLMIISLDYLMDPQHPLADL
ncbi:uncharacterized protein LOC143252391 isoform X3 [Tachypleus tridentatus]|uniref:uncharacterized protein LOC143252391 isoform X3 n=1 Tax=Tachypleus tridentatus TaxID=6853 RepID=UPI003FD0E49B